MIAWTSDELRRVGQATELRISSRRADGTVRPAVTIWHVTLADAVYVRSAHGPTNGWYRRAVTAGQGRINAGGIEKDVLFDVAPPQLQAELDQIYRGKYDRYGPGPVGAVTGSSAPETTLRIRPAG